MNITHWLDEHDLEGLGLLWLPYSDLPLREERIAQAHNEDIECVLTGLRGICCSAGGGCGLWRTRVKAGDEHDGRELHEQLGWVGVHVGESSSENET